MVIRAVASVQQSKTSKRKSERKTKVRKQLLRKSQTENLIPVGLLIESGYNMIMNEIHVWCFATPALHMSSWEHWSTVLFYLFLLIRLDDWILCFCICQVMSSFVRWILRNFIKLQDKPVGGPVPSPILAF